MRVTEVVGTSAESWEAAGRAAVAEACRGVRGLRSAEVVKQDLVIEDGAVVAFRVRLAIAFDPSAPAVEPATGPAGVRAARTRDEPRAPHPAPGRAAPSSRPTSRST